MVEESKFDSAIRPIWQLPVSGFERTGNSYISQKAKYHCFVGNVTLCEKYAQITNRYDDGITVESGTILQNPNIACKKCFKKWKMQNDISDAKESERE